MISFGAIKALGGEGPAVERLAAEVARVLKPGAAFVFIERGDGVTRSLLLYSLICSS